MARAGLVDAFDSSRRSFLSFTFNGGTFMI
jgi:hypothetical protein